MNEHAGIGEVGQMDEAVRRYRDEVDSELRPLFDRLHQLIVATCPNAEVVLSYAMPTYRDGGFSERHPELATGKGTIKGREGTPR